MDIDNVITKTKIQIFVNTKKHSEKNERNTHQRKNSKYNVTYMVKLIQIFDQVVMS
jgi:hypothetical protein